MSPGPARKRRKKVRRQWRPVPLLVLGLLASLTLGLTQSSLTAITKVRVEGVRAKDREWVQSSLSRLSGRPALKIAPEEVESRMLRASDVYAAEFRRNVFGRGVLTLEYRKPVARIKQIERGYLDETGVAYRADAVPETVPLLSMPWQSFQADFTFAGSWPSQKVAELFVALRRFEGYERAHVQIDDEGRTVIYGLWKSQVVVGSIERVPEKIEALQKILEENPAVLAHEGGVVNVVAPDHPTYRVR